AYSIPTEYDPNLALAVIWGESTEEAKTRAMEFLKGVVIEGSDAQGGAAVTNLDYLAERIDNVLKF
ncbi:MAG: biotin carboxylase N-terminal domain-containing protein, partial [Dissulfurimicrobium sp.]